MGFQWDSEAWGDPADYNVDPARTELDGVKVGDRVRALEDGDEGADQMFYAGDEGVVIGVSVTGPGVFNPRERVDLTVAFDGYDPSSAMPDQLKVIT